MVECAHGNSAPIKLVRGLSECQAGAGRHKCAICAYEAGKQAALGKSFRGPSQECDRGHAAAPLDMLRGLPNSQAGPHRHKCAYEAFQLGRQAGEAALRLEAENSQSEIEPISGQFSGSEDIEEEREISRILVDDSFNDTEKSQLILARRGQGIFRKNVSQINNRCWLTGIEVPSMLVASHIKPWRHSSNVERLDGFNGFLLAPHVDHLFDKGWISVKETGELIISPHLSAEVMPSWGIVARRFCPKLNERHLPYLDYHRRNIFRG